MSLSLYPSAVPDAVNGKFFQINRILNHISYKTKKIAFNRKTVCLAGWRSFSPSISLSPFGTKEWLRAKMNSYTHTHTQKRRHWTFCVHKMRMEIKILQMILLNIWRGILYGRKRVKFFHCLMPWFTLYDTLMTIWLFHFGLCSTFLLSSSLLWFLSVNMRALF